MSIGCSVFLVAVLVESIPMFHEFVNSSIELDNSIAGIVLVLIWAVVLLLFVSSALLNGIAFIRSRNDQDLESVFK